MSEYKPHIGKNVIETLTLGMYENAHFIYREYVQNSADQIDIAVEEGILNNKCEGRIDINIDKKNSSISIKDNATGIKLNDTLKFLGDVANSQKDRTKRKGFRGIGRLGGLGYCNTLKFITSYYGESTRSIISLDAKQLKKIIEDKNITMDAATVISVITSVDKVNEHSKEHYFEVILEDVTNDDLLDEVKVKNYLSMVAPVPYSDSFVHAEKIYQYFNKNNIKIEEYNVHLSLNNEKLYKAYKNTIHSKTGNKTVNIIDINFLKIFNNEKELIALGWYGITDLLNNIIQKEDFERGFRLRKENIQIGDEDTLNGFFKEDRFNHHFVGEVYTIGDAFVPNARRDYFNDNKTIQVFESELRNFFDGLHKLAHISSRIHSALRKINSFRGKANEFNKKSFRSKNEEDHYKQELSKAKENAQEAIYSLVKINNKAKSERNIRILYERLVGNFNELVDDLNELKIVEPEIEEIEFAKLDSKEKVIVREIFVIIEKYLSINEAENIKQKIKEYYN